MPTTFQFKGTKYRIDDVVRGVREYLDSDEAAARYDAELAKIEKTIPRVTDPKIIKVYGQDFIDKEAASNESKAKKMATAEVLKAAFTSTMRDYIGMANNPHAPETLCEVTDDMILATLNKIRAGRSTAVHRAYSGRNRGF